MFPPLKSSKPLSMYTLLTETVFSLHVYTHLWLPLLRALRSALLESQISAEMTLRHESLSIESLTELVGSERTLWQLSLMEECLYVCDAYMQTHAFMLSLKTRVLKNKSPDWWNLSNEASAITSAKTTVPSSAFPACERCLDHTTCFVTQALSWVSPAGKVVLTHCAPEVWGILHPVQGNQFCLVLPTGNEIKVNNQSNLNPLAACMHTDVETLLKIRCNVPQIMDAKLKARF